MRSAATTSHRALRPSRPQRHAGHRVAAAAPGGRSAGRRGNDGQRRLDDSPGQQARQAGVQRAGERLDQVGAAVLLDRDDGLAARAGIAAEREDRHAGIEPRSDQVRLVGLDGQFPRAGGAPPGRRRAAAPAFQRQDEVEHARSVSVAVIGDNSFAGTPCMMQDDRESFIVDCLVDAFSRPDEGRSRRVPDQVPQDGRRPVRLLPRQRMRVLRRRRRTRGPVGRRADVPGVDPG